MFWRFLTKKLRLENGAFSCFLLFSGLFWPGPFFPIFRLWIPKRCRGPFFPIFRLWIPKRCKGVHCVDLGESFPTSIYLQKSASIQPRTSPSKFGGKYSILFTDVLSADTPRAGVQEQRSVAEPPRA